MEKLNNWGLKKLRYLSSQSNPGSQEIGQSGHQCWKNRYVNILHTLKNEKNVWYFASERTNVYMSIFTLPFCSGPGHQHSKGANGSRYQSIYEPTEPSQAMMSDNDVGETKIEKTDHNTGNYVPYSFRIVCGFFNVPQSYMWTPVLSPLSLSGALPTELSGLYKIQQTNSDLWTGIPSAILKALLRSVFQKLLIQKLKEHYMQVFTAVPSHCDSSRLYTLGRRVSVLQLAE